ncbi:alpha/beta hydrolase domain-containing protein [Salinibacterium sp. GXW1014]|uniref:alpha/beta hydrolase domain-containing protein n=1 Tax=Salinibacterium sp. GXW1014 TaxID=3377838 RepID=UPI00383B3F06
MATPAMKIRTLAETTTSRAFGGDDWGVDRLMDAGYAQTELLLAGVAANEPFTVRALLRHPIDLSRASGVAVVEPMHFAGGRSAWPVIQRETVRAGHVWAEVSCQPSAVGILSSFDADRYASVALVDGAGPDAPSTASIGTDAATGRTMDDVRRESEKFRRRWFAAAVQAPEILGQFADALRSGAGPVGSVSTVLLTGLSQTGGFTRNFAMAHHAALSGTHPVFDGYLPMCSGGDALPDLDVPIIELLAESEMEQLRVSHLLPGQTVAFTHRRADSHRFRLYEVAGMSHADTRDHPPQHPGELVPGQRWSTFPSSHVVAAALASLVRWARDGHEPPPGAVFTLDRDGKLARDEHGNVTGGLRTPHVDVPTSTISAISGPGAAWLNGCEQPFPPHKLRALYGTEDAYRMRVAACLDELVELGYVLRPDADEYLAEAHW